MIFFDLEFYVPKNQRNNLGSKGTLVFNPSFQDHLLLGGSFYIKDLKNQTIIQEEHLWLWKCHSEKELIKKIFQLFKIEYERIQKEKAKILQSRVKDIITCGFGIARIDLPTLYIKGLQHKIAPQWELFNIFLKTKIIELSNIAGFLFPKEKTLYPKTTNQVSKLLLKNHSPKPNGKMVWDYYDQNDFELIENRCKDEVLDIIEIYEKIQEKLIMLEK